MDEELDVQVECSFRARIKYSIGSLKIYEPCLACFKHTVMLLTLEIEVPLVCYRTFYRTSENRTDPKRVSTNRLICTLLRDFLILCRRKLENMALQRFIYSIFLSR